MNHRTETETNCARGAFRRFCHFRRFGLTDGVSLALVRAEVCAAQEAAEIEQARQEAEMAELNRTYWESAEADYRACRAS